MDRLGSRVSRFTEEQPGPAVAFGLPASGPPMEQPGLTLVLGIPHMGLILCDFPLAATGETLLLSLGPTQFIMSETGLCRTLRNLLSILP